jgi:hypothetical protein
MDVCPDRSVDKVAQMLYKAGKIQDLCEDADFFTRLTKLEAQFPSASVLVHKQGILPPEIAALWSSPELMSAAKQFLGGQCPLCQCLPLIPVTSRGLCTILRAWGTTSTQNNMFW